jgi:hypothetical protein
MSDVMGTGWFAADAAKVKPGKTVADRLGLELTRVRASESLPLYLGHVAPFYALSPEGGCPPNRGKPRPTALSGES